MTTTTILLLPEFDKLGPLPTPSESEWPEIKQRFPVGTEVSGVVISRHAFGIFLDLGAGALGLMERPSMQWRSEAAPMASPALGMEVRGIVIGHADYNRQVRVEASDPRVRHQRPANA